MRTELRIESSIHPVLGELTKTNIYTWDETRFETLDEALAFSDPNDPTIVGYVTKEFYSQEN